MAHREEVGLHGGGPLIIVGTGEDGDKGDESVGHVDVVEGGGESDCKEVLQINLNQRIVPEKETKRDDGRKGASR